jgi:hypothetical protein
MRNPSPLPGLIFIILFVADLGLAYATMSPQSYAASVSIAVLSFVVASILGGMATVASAIAQARPAASGAAPLATAGK